MKNYLKFLANYIGTMLVGVVLINFIDGGPFEFAVFMSVLYGLSLFDSYKKFTFKNISKGELNYLAGQSNSLSKEEAQTAYIKAVKELKEKSNGTGCSNCSCKEKKKT